MHGLQIYTFAPYFPYLPVNPLYGAITTLPVAIGRCYLFICLFWLIIEL